MNGRNTITIVIADDHPLVRNGLQEVLRDESRLRIIGEASTGSELIELVSKLKPDIVITDIKMPGLDGIDAVKEIKRIRPMTGIIALSMLKKEQIVIDMLEAGAYGYLLKDADKSQIIEAIYCVHNNEPYYSSSFTRRMLRRLKVSSFKPYYKDYDKYALKPIERRMITMICDGMTNKEIAYNLKLRLKTIENYRKMLMDKLEKTSIASLVIYAVQTGLYEIPEEAE
jgi:two-component system, NarL family, response regulator NreC